MLGTHIIETYCYQTENSLKLLIFKIGPSVHIFLKKSVSSDSLKIVEGKESDVGSYKCQIPGVTQSSDSVNVYFTKELVFSPSTNPIYHHNIADQISFTCSYIKAGSKIMSPLGTLKFQVTSNCPSMEKMECSLSQSVSFFINTLNQLLNIVLNF